MANVKVKALKPFTYKGERFEPGDEVTVSAAYAKTLAKLDYIKLDSESKEKVEKATTKEKNANAGPGKAGL